MARSSALLALLLGVADSQAGDSVQARFANSPAALQASPQKRVSPAFAIDSNLPRALIVLADFKPGLTIYPSGRYLASFADASGVYYQSPYHLLRIDLGSVATLDGGFYLPRSESSSSDEPLRFRRYLLAPNPRRIQVQVGEVAEGLRYRLER